MASDRFIKAEMGKQSVFNTPVAPDFHAPVVGSYEDLAEDHEAEWDSGAWTPTTIVTRASEGARITTQGSAFFEFLPVLFNAGVDEQTPSGTATTLSANASATDTTIDITSSTGFTNGIQVNVALDNGLVHSTTQNGAASVGTGAGGTDQITLTDAMPSAATSGNAVYTNYTYTGTVPRTSFPSPIPYTWYIGAQGVNIGGTGPAVRIYDAYCENIQLTGNLNQRAVTQQSTWFAGTMDDNSDAGYAFIGSGLPLNLLVVSMMYASVKLKDAGTTGGSFTAMTSLAGVLMDWTINYRTGLRPQWSGDQAQGTMYGTTFVDPQLEFRPTIRTDSTTYGLIKAKFDDKQHQELEFVFTGLHGRQFKMDITGRWTAVPSAHDRANDEVVFRPTFMAETPYYQTTTPHWMNWELITKWNHT